MGTASNNPYPSLLIVEGTAPSSPASGQQRLFIDSADHTAKVKNSSGTVSSLGGGGLADQGIFTYLDGTVGAAPATPAAGKLRLYAKTGKVLAVKDDAGTETVLGAGGGGGSDLVQVASGAGSVRIPRLVSDPGVVPASPATNDAEFDSGTIPSGWSLHNAPANVDYNTTRKSCLYLKSANTSEGWAGIYVTSLPTPPFTLTIAVLDYQQTADYQKAGIFVSNGATGGHEALQVGRHSGERLIDYEGYGSNTAGGGGSTAGQDHTWVPVYLRCKVNSTTSIDWSWSMGGTVFRTLVAARNPGFTISRIGIGVKQESTSTQMELVVDSARFS